MARFNASSNGQFSLEGVEEEKELADERHYREFFLESHNESSWNLAKCMSPQAIGLVNNEDYRQFKYEISEKGKHGFGKKAHIEPDHENPGILDILRACLNKLIIGIERGNTTKAMYTHCLVSIVVSML